MSLPVIPFQRVPTIGIEFPNWSNTTPFTYQDGRTNAKLVESIVGYIDNVLVPYIDTNMSSVAEAWEATAQQLIDAVNSAIEEVINSSITLQDPVMLAIINNLTSQSRVKLDALYGVTAQAANIALQTSEVRTELRKLLVEDPTDPGFFLIKF